MPETAPPFSLQALLYAEIPLTRHMGIRVVAYTGSSLSLGAALEPNINHKSTAFGGSLYSLSVLAGWSLLSIKFREAGLAGQVVIQESHIVYRQPVAFDPVAVCHLEEQPLTRLLSTLRRRSRARITLISEIAGDGGPAVQHTGRYAVLA